MRFLVTVEAFDHIKTGPEEMRLREVAGAQLQHIADSGKMVEGGIFADARGGFIVVDVDTAAELQELLGPAFLVNCHVETHPILSFEELAAFFQRHANE